MEKTMGDLAGLLKQLIPRSIPERYKIKERFLEISNEECIIEGVFAFREFLYGLYDCLMTHKDLCEIPKKGKKRVYDETTLTVEFPFLNNIKSVLSNIAKYGVLSESGDSILLEGWDKISLKSSHNKNSTTKISNPQMFKSMKVLAQCGVVFGGIDLSVKKPDVTKVEAIEVTYPEIPAMVTGLKVLGIAQNELAVRKNDDILLRCDYRVLKEEEAYESVLEDFVYPLPEELQEFVIKSHEHYLDSGMKCEMDLGAICIQLVYSYKNKPLWRFTSSLHNGYRMVIKTKNTSKYTHVIETFPKPLRDKILKGYGCDRKDGTGHGNCQHGCEGYRFSLDESLLSIEKELGIWLDSEIESMQKKTKGKKKS